MGPNLQKFKKEGLLGGPRLLEWLMISLLSRGEHIIIFQYKVLEMTL